MMLYLEVLICLIWKIMLFSSRLWWKFFFLCIRFLLLSLMRCLFVVVWDVCIIVCCFLLFVIWVLVWRNCWFCLVWLSRCWIFCCVSCWRWIWLVVLLLMMISVNVFLVLLLRVCGWKRCCVVSSCGCFNVVLRKLVVKWFLVGWWLIVFWFGCM